MFMHDPANLAFLTTGPFQTYAAAIAGMPQRIVDLKALRGAEFCEVVRRMVEERWAVREVVPGWEIIEARREAELERDRRVLMEGANVLCEERGRGG